MEGLIEPCKDYGKCYQLCFKRYVVSVTQNLSHYLSQKTKEAYLTTIHFKHMDNLLSSERELHWDLTSW